MGKRTKAAHKSAGRKAKVTGKQRAARRVNIEVARRAKKSGTKGSSKGAGSSADVAKMSTSQKRKEIRSINKQITGGKRGGTITKSMHKQLVKRKIDLEYSMPQKTTYAKSRGPKYD